MEWARNKKGLTSCRVCGLEQRFFPWGEDGQTPTFDICSCCGVEFGYEDATRLAVQNYREAWLTHGAKWWRRDEMPENWCLEGQLKNVPPDFI